MKNYRLGNTITIKWTIMTATGTAYNLNASNLELFAVVPNHTIKIDDFSVAGNVVTWTFLGTDQKFTGPYTLTLIENRGQSTMMTVDYCNAFGLVRWSCQAGWDESADVNSNLSLTSEIFTHQIALSKEVQAVIDGNITEYNVSNHFPTGGIDGTNRYTLATAIAKIPESLRNVGIKCSFLNEAGEIETRQYNGGDFQEASNWGLTNVQSDIGNYNLNILAPGNYTLETAVNKLQELIPNKRFQYGIKLIFNDANGDTHSYTFCYDGNNGGITNLTRWTEEVDNPYFDFHKQHTGVAYDVAYYISEIKVEALSENVDIDADYSIGMFGYSPSYQQNIIQILKDGAFIGFLLFGNGLTATLETDDIKITITVKTFAPYTERVAVYSSNDNIIKRQLFINAKILYISSSIDKELSITSGNAVQNSAITGRLSATTYIPKDTTSTLEDILKNIPEHELSLVKRIVYLDKNRADRPTIAVACARNISALPDVGSWILLDVRELNAVANMAALSGFNMGSMPSYTLEEIVSGFLGTQKVMPGKIIIYKDKSDGYTVALFNSDSTISGWTNIANWVKVPFSSLKNLVTKSDLEKKVDKITGKGLSTNDYTNKDKNKLDSIDPDAFISKDMIREAVTAITGRLSATTYIPKDTTSTLEDILKNIPEHELSLVKRIVYLDKNRADRPTIAVACARNISALPDVGSWILLDVRELNAVANMAALSGFNMGSMPSYTLEEIVSGFLGTQKVMPGKIIIYKDKSDGYTVALFNSDSTISGWTNIANWVKVPFSSLKNLVTKSDLEKKVDKITGKGLSTNDYTDKDKKKLDSIDPDAFISEDMIREAVTAYVNENSGGFVTQERGLNVIDYFTYEVGENILENATVVGTGWSGDLASGYTHQAGNTEPLEFALPGVSNGDRLLVRFSADITSEDNDILVSVGDSPQIKSYNGTSSIAAGLIFTEGNLRITPRSGFSGTITDISCCVIDKGENRVTLNQRIVRNLPNDFVYGFWNVFIGVTAAKKLQDGTRSIAIGEQAMQGMIVGNRNVAIGTFSMPYLTRGENNVAIGSDTIYPLVEADNCVGIGKQTLGGNKIAKDCVAIGMNALGSYSFDKDRVRCVGVGVNAGPRVSENCTHIGYRAGANVLGANNTSIGYNAMAVGERSSADIVGSELTCVGYKSEIANTDEAKAATNSTAIGANTTITKSNQVIIGNNAVEEVIIAGKKIIFYADGTVKWETA